MDPSITIAELALATLLAHGASELTMNSLSVTSRKGRVSVSYTGGPDAQLLRDALHEVVIASPLKHKSVNIVRTTRWTCNRLHADGFDAWLAHEGAQYVRPEVGEDCELGCDGAHVIEVDTLRKLLSANETFRSTSCFIVE